MAAVTSLQSSVVEGPRREVKLEPETTVNTGLDADPVMEVGSISTSESPREAARSISATEVAALKTSTPLANWGKCSCLGQR